MALVVSIIIIVKGGEYALWATKDEMVTVVRKVAQDYRKEQNFNDACSINGKPVSLGGVLYALAIQEGWWRDGTVGARSNNRGSLHWSMGLKPVVKYIRADGTNTRPVYETAYDGVYEKAHLIATKPLYNKCNIGYKQLFSYIVGPNANPNKLHPTKVWGKNLTNSEYVKRHLSKMYGRAYEFDQAKWSTIVNSENPKKGGWSQVIQGTKNTQSPTRTCYWARKIQAGDYVQLDVNWEMYKQIDTDWVKKGTIIDVFNCFGEKQ